MRDLFAGVVALVLLLVAASLATTLKEYRRRRQRTRDAERALGRTIIAEVPTDDGLVLFTEDAKRFHYGERSIDKDLITVVRLLINGSPIASCVSRLADKSSRTAELGAGGPGQPDRGTGDAGARDDDPPEGIARDRWDVAIETVAGTTLVECGTIRERVSQELARTVYNAVKKDLDTRDAATSQRR